MRSSRLLGALATPLMLAALLTARHTPLGAEGPGLPLAVVVNKANPVENLTVAQVRDLVTGRVSTWPNGRRVVLVLSDDHEAKAALLKWCCRQSPAEYDEAMLRAVFTGEIPSAPKKLDSAEAVTKFVFNVAGGIGVAPAGEVTDIVKTVRVAGLTPADAAYPLRAR